MREKTRSRKVYINSLNVPSIPPVSSMLNNLFTKVRHSIINSIYNVILILLICFATLHLFTDVIELYKVFHIE